MSARFVQVASALVGSIALQQLQGDAAVISRWSEAAKCLLTSRKKFNTPSNIRSCRCGSVGQNSFNKDVHTLGALLKVIYNGTDTTSLTSLVQDIQLKSGGDDKPLVDVDFGRVDVQQIRDLVSLGQIEAARQLLELRVGESVSRVTQHFASDVVARSLGLEKDFFNSPNQDYYQALEAADYIIDSQTFQQYQNLDTLHRIGRIARFALRTQEDLQRRVNGGHKMQEIHNITERDVARIISSGNFTHPYLGFTWPENAQPEKIPLTTMLDVGGDNNSTISIPGARFKENYYWDTYWVIRGLVAAGNLDYARHLVERLFIQVDQLGFVPNGTRTYYLDRSQPPVLGAAVDVVVQGFIDCGRHADADALKKTALPRLLRDYLGFWMGASGHVVMSEGGRLRLLEDNEAIGGLALLENLHNPKIAFLNRYSSSSDKPRPESYTADLESAKAAQQLPNSRYTHQQTRASAESGWDFSSRWRYDAIKDGEIDSGERDHYAAQQDTLHVLPVELNTLLWKTEKVIEDFATDDQLKATFEVLARKRQQAMDKYMKVNGVYHDYHWGEGQVSKVISAGAFAPAAFGLTTELPNVLQEELIKEWGVVPENVSRGKGGEQWDSPNCWPPLLQWAVQALVNAGKRPEAMKLAAYYVVSNQFFWDEMPPHERLKALHSGGGYPEKVSVDNPGRKGEGGEYVCQTGFGWTCGVLLELVTRYGRDSDFVRHFEEAEKEIDRLWKMRAVSAQLLCVCPD